ncbi:MAG: DAK2 domain-containing protein [Nostocoides sp.]
MRDVLTARGARQWALVARTLLAAHRHDLDRLNVYPVPDGDTGTNLLLTYEGALASTSSGDVSHAGPGAGQGERTLSGELSDFARALLLSARGNSGVILSQLVRGFADVVSDDRAEELDAALGARATRRGADVARAAVVRPVEGTVLTVADAVADAAETAVKAGAGLAELVTECRDAALAALARTPDQLPVLKAAGVVDAGAAGYVLLVEALRRVLATDGTPSGDPMAELRSLVGGGGPIGSSARLGDDSSVHPFAGERPGKDVTSPNGPAYEVMYLVDGTDESRVQTLRGTLDALGDSLLVVGGPDLWSVHVHVDDPGAAIEAGIAAGSVRRIAIQHFATQISSSHAAVAVVACAAGPGIAALFEEAGAVVVPSGPGGRASAGSLLQGVKTAGASTVLLLPNDRDTQMAAAAAATAARADGVTVHVIPARTVVQGISALAVFDPEASATETAVAMTEAATATRHGGVTIAAREGITSAGRCQVGDVLGIVDGDFVIIGADLTAVAVAVLHRLLGDGGELVTLVLGLDAPEGIGAAVEAAVVGRGLEVASIDGGQPHYPLLIGVE